MTRSAKYFLIGVWGTLAFIGLVSIGDAEEESISFEEHVRPILKAHCFQCHGEAGEKEASLDLRLRRFILAGGESGSAINLMNSEKSLLLERVRSGEMPPGEEKQLKPAEIELLARWIATGAKTAHDEPEEIGDGPIFTFAERNYWAFQPILRPKLPTIRANDRMRTPVDAFILAKLEQTFGDKFVPTPDADLRLLVRRASFDLLGLPPSPEMVAAFETDRSPGSWERLVDRLLASPHYGERWGRHWLDVVGYADSEGYTEEDRVRPHAFRYRDYVIRAFNDDMPFDRFIQEQLAGDELAAPLSPNLTEQQAQLLSATGFLRMGPDGTASGGIDQAVARNQVIADTMQIVGTSLLGMTFHCAQCHDHRYDPIPQSDYYSLRAIFEPAFNWKAWKAPPSRQISLYTDIDREIAQQIETEAVVVDKERAQKAEEYITRTLEEELLLVPEDVRDALRDAYRSVVKDRTPEQIALLKEYPSVERISVGSLYLYDRRRDERARKLDSQRLANEKRFVEETRQRELAKIPKQERAVVEAAFQQATEMRTDEQRELLAKYPGVLVSAATLGQFNPEAAKELEIDRAKAAELRATKAAVDLQRYSDRAAEIRKRKPKEGFVRALTETAGQIPSTYLFHRGDHNQPKQVLEPAGLSILGLESEFPAPNTNAPSSGRRLAWARHLTNGKHPLVPRVIVNRLWMHHFGRGLVNSPGDFGFLGERPTHPQLLDWLAAEFIDSGWSAKHIHRLIMNSSVYCQSSQTSAVVASTDPDDRLYSRFPLQRLQAEIIRDAVLSVSGKLNDTFHGESVPVMEDEVGQIILGIENLDGERKPTKPIPLHGEEFRRSVYIQVRRSRTFSVFEAFDAPDMSPNCERRNVSTVALQSLMLMNSDFVTDFSGQFADRLIHDAGDKLSDQIELGWRLTYSVAPQSAEISAAKQFIEHQQDVMQQQTPKATPEEINRQALASYCQALISSNRFLYVE